MLPRKPLSRFMLTNDQPMNRYLIVTRNVLAISIDCNIQTRASGGLQGTSAINVNAGSRISPFFNDATMVGNLHAFDVDAYIHIPSDVNLALVI
ncbi:MAG TPA: hypothetical protein DCL09_07395 [Sutterella sp.]|nr:hypothetical protein [Sutterella sp.]